MDQYWMSFDTTTCLKRTADVLVIGSGAAGLQTAWSLAEKGRHVLVTVRDTLADSNTAKAQGGVASALGPDDNPSLHLKDTLIAGAGLTDQKMAEIVVTEGPKAVLALKEHGAEFDENPDGTLALGREGAHSRNRIVHAHGDSTGAEISRSLRSITAKEETIENLEDCYVTDLLVKDGTCYGAIALYNGAPLCIYAHAVVLATGGVGRIFAHTTNPAGAVGSGIDIAFRAGAAVKDMEFIQFHPTALAIPGKPSFLVSEAVRGAGALLYNTKGERFMPSYHPMKELAPRDVVARAIGQEMAKNDTDHVFLDATGIEDVADKFPMIAETLLDYGIDMAKERIPIAPAAHYMMGGVDTDSYGQTNIHNLYACGEVACTGLQGANRLASNSLLEGLVVGRRVADAICQNDDVEVPDGLFWQSELPKEPLSHDEIKAIRQELKQLMSRYMGIARNEDDLKKALSLLKEYAKKIAGHNATTAAMLDLKAHVSVAILMTEAALARHESRGAHFRSDYPKPESDWQQHSVETPHEPGKVEFTE